MEPRVKLYVPKEGSFPIPLKYIDVTRTTHTSLDVLLEKHIDDYWNVDEDRDLSDAWTGFTRFILLNERPPDGLSWCGRENDEETNDHQNPAMCGQICGSICLMHRNAKRSEKPELDNARQLRGIFFIEPDDEEFKHTMKNARRKLEIPMQAAMPYKTPVNCRVETHCGIGKRKTKHACIVDESTRIRLEEAPYRYHEDHIAAKGINSLSHNNLVHKFIPMPQALKIPDAKVALEKEWVKLVKIPAWQLVRNKKEVIDEARNEGRKVHFASLMNLCHLKHSELEPKFQVQRQSCTKR